MNVNGIEVSKVLKFRATPGFGKWKRYFPEEAVAHPAKINLILLEYLIQHYTEEGDSICDPMSGSGSTGILAALNNRNAICVELEDKFYEMQVGVDCDGYSCHVLGCCERRELEARVKQLETELKECYATEDLICNWADEDVIAIGAEDIDEEKLPPDVLELYHKFKEHKEAKGKLEKLPKKPHHFIGCKELFDKTTLITPKGSVIFLKGDARRLSDTLKEREIWHILFSPPYSSAGAKADENPENYMRRMQERYELMKEQGIKRPEMEPGRYSGSWDNIGNLPYFDVIVSSPPYAQTTSPFTRGVPVKKGDGLPRIGCLNMQDGYSESVRNIGNLPINLDVCMFSPPYSVGHDSGNHASEEHGWRLEEQRKHTRAYGGGNIAKLPFGTFGELSDSILTSPPYFDSKSDWDETSRGSKEGEVASYADERHQERDNIGNVHYYDEGEPIAKKYARANGKETYLEAMKKVYGECYKILKPQGLLILILKNFIRDKQLVPLSEHTIKLCESVGFSLKERLLFKLPQLSFWRILERRKWKEEGKQYPEDLSYEHVLVFEKYNG